MLRKIRSLALKNTRGVVVDIEADVARGSLTSYSGACRYICKRGIRKSQESHTKQRIRISEGPYHSELISWLTFIKEEVTSTWA